MRTRAPFMEILLLAIGVVVLTVLGVVREQRETSGVESYSSYDAQPGGYRAWYELLQREGVNVARCERRWAFLDRTTTTLILAMPAASSPISGISASGQADLESWIRDGGTLVMLASSAALRNTKFSSLRYRVLSPEYFQGMGIASTGLNGVPRIGEVLIGHGKVLWLQNASYFTNARIGAATAARLAYALGASTSHGATAFDETMHGGLIPERWWQAAPRRLVFAIIGSCVVLAAAFFGATMRLGPPMLPEKRREASSVEYVHAVAALYERAGARGKVLQDVAASMRHVATRPGALSPEMRIAMDEMEALARIARPSDNDVLRGVTIAAQAWSSRF